MKLLYFFLNINNVRVLGQSSRKYYSYIKFNDSFDLLNKYVVIIYIPMCLNVILIKVETNIILI